MGIKEIAREEIPNWSVGNVVIKTFSYGDKLRMAGVMKKIFKDINSIKNEVDEKKILDNLKEDVDLSEVTIDLVVAGVSSIKNFDNQQFLITPNSSREEKAKFIYNIDYEAGNYLLKKILEMNKPISDETKKESS